MTQDDVIETAREAGFEIDCCSLDWHKRITAFANLVAAKAIQKEQDRCCAIVFGQCESDNVAQRTVNAIRGKA